MKTQRRIYGRACMWHTKPKIFTLWQDKSDDPTPEGSSVFLGDPGFSGLVVPPSPEVSKS